MSVFRISATVHRRHKYRKRTWIMKYLRRCTNLADLEYKIEHFQIEEPYVAVVGSEVDYNTLDFSNYRSPSISGGEEE